MPHAVQSREFRALSRVISALLYAWDPEGLGRSIGSPEDEYDDVAHRLISSIARARPELRVEDVVCQQWPTASAAFAAAVGSAWLLYELARDARLLAEGRAAIPGHMGGPELLEDV